MGCHSEDISFVGGVFCGTQYVSSAVRIPWPDLSLTYLILNDFINAPKGFFRNNLQKLVNN